MEGSFLALGVCGGWLYWRFVEVCVCVCVCVSVFAVLTISDTDDIITLARTDLPALPLGPSVLASCPLLLASCFLLPPPPEGFFVGGSL